MVLQSSNNAGPTSSPAAAGASPRRSRGCYHTAAKRPCLSQRERWHGECRDGEGILSTKGIAIPACALVRNDVVIGVHRNIFRNFDFHRKISPKTGDTIERKWDKLRFFGNDFRKRPIYLYGHLTICDNLLTAYVCNFRKLWLLFVIFAVFIPFSAILTCIYPILSRKMSVFCDCVN